MNSAPNPSHIMQIGTGFFASKTLLSAVELGLFTYLAEGSRTAAEIEQRLELHPRATRDFLDALVSLGLLQRAGSSATGSYANTTETELFLDRTKPSYIGGILEMANARLYRFWGPHTALRSGGPQNEAKHGGNLFGEIYADPARLEGFINAMSGIQLGAFMALAEKFDFSPYKTVCDVGGSGAALSITLARVHGNLSFQSFDLAPVAPIATRNIAGADLSSRIQVVSGDFFSAPLPKADVIVMGNILHDWNLEKKKQLIAAAYDALPDHGVLIAVENIIDDDRRNNAFGLLMSLNMLIETGDGFDYTGRDFADWTTAAGFQRTTTMPLAGPTSAAIAYKRER